MDSSIYGGCNGIGNAILRSVVSGCEVLHLPCFIGSRWRSDNACIDFTKFDASKSMLVVTLSLLECFVSVPS